MKNTPYVKKYENGILANPIKESYVNNHPSRSERRAAKRSLFAKPVSKNQGVIVTGIGTSEKGHAIFVKYQKVRQQAGNKVLQHTILSLN